jgi:hypothetical protein
LKGEGILKRKKRSFEKKKRSFEKNIKINLRGRNIPLQQIHQQ